MAKASTTATALRRYPTLAYLAGALSLALLLPNSFTIPNASPSTLAEFAPVPGQSPGQADIATLGGPVSGGQIGFGAGTEASPTTLPGTPGTAPGVGAVRRAGNKRCVGEPPRQTEDLLSPPCVAFFNGDNFGATAKGVTGDEVRVVIYMNAKLNNDREFVDCLAGPDPNDANEDVACKAYNRFFNLRYQTYGRTVHVWMFHGTAGTSSAEGVRMARINEIHDPFLVGDSPSTQGQLEKPAAASGVMAVTYGGFLRSFYETYAPHVMSFRPDLDDQVSIASSFICLQLAGRPARMSGMTSDQTRRRKFGIMQDASRRLSDRYVAALKQCGEEVVTVGSATGENGIAKLQSAGVTTVIPLGGYQTQTRDATAQRWFPEWFVPGSNAASGYSDLDTNAAARTADPAQWANAFGVTFDYRRDARNEQNWYRAYHEGCPDCRDPDQSQPTGIELPAVLYDMFSLIYYGIQAAGPRLTIANVDKGMHAIPPNGSPNPYKPAAYFSPGNYTFVKDATAMWWDPSAMAPGDPAPGCYRLVDEGRRRRAGEWPAGDLSLQDPARSPCQGSLS